MLGETCQRRILPQISQFIFERQDATLFRYPAGFFFAFDRFGRRFGPQGCLGFWLGLRLLLLFWLGLRLGFGFGFGFHLFRSGLFHRWRWGLSLHDQFCEAGRNFGSVLLRSLGHW